MRVLVACEFSGIVRDAFRALGHDAWSCDLLPTERPGQHIVDDVRNVIYPGRHGSLHRQFDLMIAHIPCTYLANSGVRWLVDELRTGVIGPRVLALQESIDFFNQVALAPISMIAMENPIPHKYAKRGIGYAGKGIGMYTQKIRGDMFGEEDSRTTCLWLKRLPLLVPTNQLPTVAYGSVEWKARNRVHRASPGPNRWKERSRTLPGIATAMADQWGSISVERAA